MALDKGSSNENQFYDSDEEDSDNKEASSKKMKITALSSDDLEGALSLKPGRNANTSLYYVDYSKFPNDGNGLFPDDRNALLGEHEKVKADMEAYLSNLKEHTTRTCQLLSEPTNASADESIQTLEKEVEVLMEKVESAQEFQVNESYRKKILKGIQVMASQWRKRKRLCMDFLITMEECTEGSVSISKAMAADGPMELDSDEAIIKGAILFTKQRRNGKRPRSNMTSSRLKVGDKNNNNSEISANPAFIGIRIDRQGKTERVYLEE